jgi:hypothetical protein
MQDDKSEPHLVELLARLLHAFAAGVVTYAAARMIGLHVDAAHESALINACLAYYTDDAVGRVTYALKEAIRIIRPQHHQRSDLEERRFQAWLRDHSASELDAIPASQPTQGGHNAVHQ